MKMLLVIALIAAMAWFTYYVFKHGKRADEMPDGQAHARGCAGCGAAAYCNDVKRFEKVVDIKTRKKE